jgi:predicted branched-subunit amino acid permease
MAAPTAPGAARPWWRDPDFLQGVRDMAPLMPAVAAWGVVTGVTMANSGMGLVLAVTMSLLVFGGSAQLVAVPLVASGAPVWVVLATAACVNLRFAVISVAWRPYFRGCPRAQRWRLAYFAADLNYIIFAQRYPKPEPLPGQIPYFWGSATINWWVWHVASLAGIFLGDRVPLSWGFGFAGTLALLGMVCALVQDRASSLALAVAAAASLAAYALPLKLHIVVAIAAAVAAGAMLDAMRTAAAPGRAAR